MKARIRGTNIELDVQPCYDETGYFAGFKNDYEYYRAADLVFPDTPEWDKTDWSAFRREAVKDFCIAILSNPAWAEHFSDDKDFRFGEAYYKRVVIENAISYADYLIEKLKEEKK